MIQRFLERQIKERLFLGKVIILYGPRQVGKTTLIKKILDQYPSKGKYLNCELPSIQETLSNLEASVLKSFFGEKTLIVLDEAQKIPNIGLILKILVDTYPEIQIIATGSSSFDLGNKLSEPLTGRHFTFTMYPVSISEFVDYEDKFVIQAKLENLLRFGSYPEPCLLGEQQARERLEELSSDYLYKDILMFEGIKKPGIIRKLLQLLALQIGNEVSFSEIATILGVNRLTIQKYIDLLEQSFVVFQLNAFSRNKRNEINKGVKIYFYDLGIRNTLIQNFSPLHLRNDTGALRENFCISERYKHLANKQSYRNSYFWRTYTQKEIDYIEDFDGKLEAYEFKRGKKKSSASKFFEQQYGTTVKTISKDNFFSFLE